MMSVVPLTIGIAITNMAPAAIPVPSHNPANTQAHLEMVPSVFDQTPAASELSQASDPSNFAPVATDASSATPDRRQVECMAKVIVHEAGNQPRVGQVAVAQVIRTRMKDGRFGSNACSVVKQRGQFFDVDAYEPSRTNKRWSDAVEIATDTLNNEGEEVVPGALFFHAVGSSMPQRTRVAKIADHIFYR